MNTVDIGASLFLPSTGGASRRPKRSSAKLLFPARFRTYYEPRLMDIFSTNRLSVSAGSKRPYTAPAGVPTQEGPKGIRFDFNDGCRVTLPEAAQSLDRR
jgi:hypothetical protein